jgi:hypothetical protein
VLILALIAVLVVVNGAPWNDATRPSQKRAAIELTSPRPLTAVGRGFKPSERVLVSAGSSRKSLLASTRGRFVARFADVDPCNAVAVTAVGSRGSRASVAVSGRWRVDCAAP